MIRRKGSMHSLWRYSGVKGAGQVSCRSPLYSVPEQGPLKKVTGGKHRAGVKDKSKDRKGQQQKEGKRHSIPQTAKVNRKTDIRDKGHYVIIKGSILQEDITIINTYWGKALGKDECTGVRNNTSESERISTSKEGNFRMDTLKNQLRTWLHLRKSHSLLLFPLPPLLMGFFLRPREALEVDLQSGKQAV